MAEKLGFLHNLKRRFAASPDKRDSASDEEKSGGKGAGRGADHPQAATIREAYTTVLLEASEQGVSMVGRKQEAMKTAATLASRWTGTEITEEDVKGVLGR